MEKILILGGSHRDIPLIEASKDLGFFVITLGNNDRYIGHRYADKSYNIDFNNLDSVRGVIKKENIRYLIPGCGEESYMRTIELADEFNIGNFDKPEIAKVVHNKWKFKEFCLNNGISTPKGFYYDSNIKSDILSYPLIIKPTNYSGGRGVSIAYNKLEFDIAIGKAKNISNEIFIEEFIDGTLVAYSVIFVNKKILYGFTGKDLSYKNPYLVTTAFPVSLDPSTEKRMRKDLERIASGLNLCDGVFHAQFLIKNKIPYIIDVTRRIPGDLYPYLIELCDGVKYSKAAVNLYTKGVITNELSFKYKKQKFFVRHVIMSKSNGIFRRLKISQKMLENIKFKIDLIENGYEIDNYLTTQISIILYPGNRKDIIGEIDRNIEVTIAPPLSG